MSKAVRKVVKNFFWPIYDRQTVKDLETFIKFSIVRGVHHSDVLAELVTEYNRRFEAQHPELRGIKLAHETDLLKALRQAKTPVSRCLLVRYRESRMKVDGLIPLFWTDGRRVVYNLEACKLFFKARAAAA